MGKLLDEIENRKPKNAGRKLKLPDFLKQLDSQDAQDLLVALADEKIQSKVICEVLAARGYEISQSSVGRFRNKHL